MAAVRRDYLEARPGTVTSRPVQPGHDRDVLPHRHGHRAPAHQLARRGGHRLGAGDGDICGQAGRPTAGVTRSRTASPASSVPSPRPAGPGPSVHRAARTRLPALQAAEQDTPGQGLELGYRRLWAGLRATSELAGGMFEGYPRFAAPFAERVTIGPETASVSAKPALKGPDDWFALVTRLRVVMEDPTQLLSGAVTDYASSELVAHANDPSAVTVPASTANRTHTSPSKATHRARTRHPARRQSMNRQRRPSQLRLPVLAVGAALAVTTVAACGSAAPAGSAGGSAAGSSSSSPITVGMSLPMTGRSPTSRSPATRATSCGPARSTPQAGCSAARSS